MKVAIHQLHYFPWLGYLDKIAKVDKFIILDDVQLIDSSVMVRNKFLDNIGQEHFLSISIDKKDYLHKKCREISLKNWERVRKKHSKFLFYNYKKSIFFDQIWEKIAFIFEKDYLLWIDLQIDILNSLLDILNIKTEIIYQSSLKYNIDAKKNELVLELCKVVSADKYLSGIGAKKYMDIEPFKKEKINVQFQNFSYPLYTQVGSNIFIKNLSSLDFLFNCGITEGRKIFWDNVRKGREFNN